MVGGLSLTIGSLFFMLLLFIVYFSQERFLSIRNKVYRYMLATILFVIISEIISSFCIKYYHNDFVNLLLLRMHWSTGIIWFFLLYYYSVIFIEDLKEENLFKVMTYNSYTLIMTSISIAMFIGYFFFPFNKIDSNYISYMPGLASSYVFIYCAISVLSIIFYMLLHINKTDKRIRRTVWIMIIEMVVIFGFQLVFPPVAFSPIGASIQMFFLYFNIENPDLKIIKELNITKDEIEKSSKAKSDFLSNMSHEIRSPMNAIIGFSSTLLNDPNFDEKSARNDIKHIASAGNNLLDIINNILDISKIESGKDTLNLKEYSLSSIIMELSSIVEARLGNSPIKFIIDVDKSIPSKFYGDSTKLFQVLLNILTNAVKYTEVGKIKLTVTGTKEGEYENLNFKVSDTGYGIKKEDFDKLFAKFSRLETATNNEIEGTGLGLVITKKYVDLMGGKIWFESEYEVGTTFYVELSQKIVDDKEIGNVTEPIKQTEEKLLDCSAFKVLIVDDNKLNIKVASRILSSYKFNIDTASSGKECIYKVKEGNDYDIIFLDHMMPELDGIETLHILRKLEDYDLPPIVALTANAITGMREMYLKEGFDEYLPKPINLADLNKLINKYFNK